MLLCGFVRNFFPDVTYPLLVSDVSIPFRHALASEFSALGTFDLRTLCPDRFNHSEITRLGLAVEKSAFVPNDTFSGPGFSALWAYFPDTLSFT